MCVYCITHICSTHRCVTMPWKCLYLISFQQPSLSMEAKGAKKIKIPCDHLINSLLTNTSTHCSKGHH